MSSKDIGIFSNINCEKAISVGCGSGVKELWLMQMCAVGHFQLFDISKENIRLGKQEAERLGLANRANFHAEDAFAAPLGKDYDLVYWNNALHHMPNVWDAVRWSYDRLKPGGLFAMDDFVGPSRFQWSEDNLRWASAVRQQLPERYLRSPDDPNGFVSRDVDRPTPEQVIATDPSEAVDSGRILAAIDAFFPGAEVIPTGGALYVCALNDIFLNFITEEDLILLEQILLMDQMLARYGETHYAVALAVKGNTRELLPVPERTFFQALKSSVKKATGGRFKRFAKRTRGKGRIR
ncbi:MAG: class I SAM-dependent methyltransferase [Rhodospirillales bacterium]|nr:class I SAM-dependent methyltransferase [Rhodospirillales bacterium]